MSGTLLRCTCVLPGGVPCGCPIRWDVRDGWRHDPSVNGEGWDDYPRLDRALHTPRPPDWAPSEATLRVSGSRAERLAASGRATRRRAS